MWKVVKKYDYKATKKKVEKILEDYQELKLKLDDIPYYSASQLKFICVDEGNKIIDKVSIIGNYEIKKQEQERNLYFNIVKSYEKLDEEDQIMIGNLYFKTKRGYTNDVLMIELGLSRDSFYDAKKCAIINFGIALGVAVEKNYNKALIKN